MVKHKNPFIIYGYAGPEYFCDREEETKKLVSALINGRNVTLMSPRRMGKTGLIHNAFYDLSLAEPEVKCFYMDIFSTSSLAEFTQLFAQTVLGQLDTAGEKWINRMIDFFNVTFVTQINETQGNRTKIMLLMSAGDSNDGLEARF